MALMQTLLTMLAASGRLTTRQAATLLDRSRRNVYNAAASLVRRGMAALDCGCYMVTPAGMEFLQSGAAIKPGPTGPLGARAKPPVIANTLRRTIWNAMRIKGKFSLDDLAGAVLDGTETARTPEKNISRYVYPLAAAGYLVEMKRRQKGEPVRWYLVRNSGPLSPVLRNNGDVWDPNEERLYTRGGDHE